jgi:4-hydroxy-2-oxoheptanedioate aldolase
MSEASTLSGRTRNPVRERLRAGESTVGCFLALGSPSAAELLSHLAFDWLVIETEHSALDTAQVEHMLMAISATDTVALVRVPALDAVFIQRSLDLGALGILVPLVRTAEDARAAVAATRFPPQGTRSFGPLRAARYSLDYSAYLAHANESMLVALIVETKEAVDNLEQIARVPGVDVLYFGLFDLCLSLGLDPLRLPLPEVDELLQRALQISSETGVAIGFSARTAQELVDNRARGFRFLGFSTDYFLLLDGARKGLEALRR